MLLRKVKVVSKNPIIIHEDYAEIVLLDRRGNEKARAKVSISKLPLVRKYRWSLTGNGYVMSSDKVYLHRLVTGNKYMEVDHRDRDKLNNMDDNLRPSTRSQNSFNKMAQSNSKSGVKGVYKCKTTGKWATEINVRGKRVWLGRFDNLEDAKAVRAKAEEKYFKDFRYKPKEVD
jgi:hypothetical protein